MDRRIRRSGATAVWLAALVVVATPALAEFPKPTGYVTDTAHILTDVARAHVEATISDTERDTAAEIAVAIVPSLDGMSVEEYANKLFAAWGVGKKKADNGVLLLVAVGDRKMRIEVGYGLEGVLPDGLAGDIIRNQLTPAFKTGDYSNGVSAGVDRIAGIVRAGHVLTPEEVARLRQQASASNRPPMLVMVLFFGVFVTIGCAALGSGFRLRAFSPILFGLIFAGVPMAMAAIPVFNAPLWVLIPLGVVSFAFGYRKGASSAWARQIRGTPSGSSGWVMGSSGGGSSSSDGGGSFGGGSSGGGGASGSW